MLKIVFFGSDDFAVMHLETLLNSGHWVAACVTPPDQPKGRGMKTVPCPVAARAQEAGLDLLQPESLKGPEVEAVLRAYGADVFVVIAYGKFLPEAILAVPRYGAVNVHGSLLPKYRGAAPINWALIHGEAQTGVSIIRMNARMDAGDIIARAELDIAPGETAPDLRMRLARLGTETLMGALTAIEQETAVLTPQDEGAVTLAPKLSKTMGLIRWDLPAEQIDRCVRGLLPWPCAYTFWQGQMIKILEAAWSPEAAAGTAPGTVLSLGPEGLCVAAGTGRVSLKRVLPQSSRPMEAADFARGHQIGPGARFSADADS